MKEEQERRWRRGVRKENEVDWKWRKAGRRRHCRNAVYIDTEEVKEEEQRRKEEEKGVSECKKYWQEGIEEKAQRRSNIGGRGRMCRKRGSEEKN